MHRFLALFLVPVVSAVEIRVATFNVGAHFGETYFDYGIGDVTTQDHLAVRAVLSRIDADVVALQEIHTADLAGSPTDLNDLAAFLGYPYQHVASISGAFDNTFQTVILSRYPFITEGDINSPPGAKEITRLHPVVKVDVPGTTNDPVIISTHLKSETGLAERFRRAVEMRRVVGHVENAGLTNSDNFIVLGDFNPSSSDTEFAAPPSGLPGSYVLGNDITFPVSYRIDPVDYFTSPGAARLEPRQLDDSASTYDTTDSGGPTLDLILVSPAMAARPTTSEVYNSSLDVSNETGLPKAGSPLADSTSAAASDHYAVFADVNLDAAGPYTFTAPGQTVMEDFTVPFGKASVLRAGSDVTIVSFGIGCAHALAAAETLAGEGISAEVVNLRTLRPIDYDTVLASVMKTNRCVTVEEGFPVGSIGDHIASTIMQRAFDYLDAPVITVAGKDVPMPYAAKLEKLALPNVGEVVEAVKAVTYRS